jgi:hypothetical protein
MKSTQSYYNYEENREREGLRRLYRSKDAEGVHTLEIGGGMENVLLAFVGRDLKSGSRVDV